MSTFHGAAEGQDLPLVDVVAPANDLAPWPSAFASTSPRRAPSPLGARLKATIPRIAVAFSLLIGAGSLLSAGSAQAANAYACAPKVPAGPGGIFSINFNAILAGDTITCGDKEFTINSFNFGNPGSIDFEWVEINPLPGFADDLFSANINFTPSLVGIVGGKTGFFDYNLKILDPKFRFDSVQLDSTVAVNVNSPGKTSVIKSIVSGPTLFSLDGAPDGPVAFQTPSPITVRDTWNVVNRDVLTNIKDTYTQEEVPSPLPLLGAGLAFGWSRKLRSRVRAAGLA